MTLLSAEEVESRLAELEDWQIDGNEMIRQFDFKDFAEAMQFVNRIAELAEAANHHPDIAISWNRVMLTLSTHSEGGLTANDFALAKQISRG